MYHPRIFHSCNVLEVSPLKWLISKALISLFFYFWSWFHNTIPDEDWAKFDWKAKSTIQLCISDSVLLNVYREATTKNLWVKLGILYQTKSLVNKLFLWKNLYNLRMK